MLYNSFTFIFLFLPVTLGLFYSLSRFPRASLLSLIFASLVFYAYFDLFIHPDSSHAFRSLIILLLSIAFNYTAGVLLKSSPSRLLLSAAIAVNLGALAYFKYANFFITSLNSLSGTTFPALAIALPLGISFFTFTQIAFLVDSYKGQASELNLRRYSLFVTFFPHLIAGPIVHHRDLMPQFAERDTFRWNSANFSAGICFFVLGLFKKVAIADTVGPWASAVFDSNLNPTFLDAWSGALSYTFQLYFDFSGYSDMAIGLALLFNTRLPDNFNAPYRASSIIDFWSRWHITLSQFLRDYLYIPLGGNRKGITRRYINLMITMALGGLWHGAGFAFLLWGIYHGILLCIAHLGRAIRPIPSILSRPLTFLAVVFGWVLFRSGSIPHSTPTSSLHRATTILQSLITPTTFSHTKSHLPAGPNQFILLFILLGFVNLAPTTRQYLESRPLLTRRHAILFAFLFFVSLLLMRDAVLTDTPNLFIYFQF